MKKILTASLVAVMAVTAANADIASVEYVGEKTGFVAENGNLTTAVNALASRVDTAEGKVELVSTYTDANKSDSTKATTNAAVTAALGTLGDLATKDTVSNADLDSGLQAAVSAANSAVQPNTLTTTLNSYVTSEALGQKDYASKTEAQGYATTAETNAKNAIGKANFVVKKNATDTGTTFNANATENVELNLGLATVATSGSYNDLSGKPTIPSKVTDLTDAGDYVTDSELTTTLGSYATTAYVDTAETDAVNAAKTYTDGKFTNADAQITGLTTRMTQAEGGISNNTGAIDDINEKLGALAGKQIPANPCTTGKCSLVWDAGADSGAGAFVWEAIK